MRILRPTSILKKRSVRSSLRSSRGSMLAPGMEPLAMLYSGHQFGVYVPQLGDGRAILPGEVKNDKAKRWDLHLKGEGMTPFSRHGGGRAVLRSTSREYLGCAAMQGLRGPPTQALCIVGSDDKVHREQVETGAIGRSMASRRLGPWRHEHRQYVNSRPHAGLRAIRVYGRLRC